MYVLLTSPVKWFILTRVIILIVRDRRKLCISDSNRLYTAHKSYEVNPREGMHTIYKLTI